MQTIINQMLEQYRADSLGEECNALKEVVQEVALCGLSRAGFFKSAAFYGGTALRIFYGLDRFSEDLDFSLTAPDPSFDLSVFSDFGERNPSDGPKFHRGRKGKVCGVKYPVGVSERQHKGTHFKLF